jgi:hypothetical protein
MRSWLVGFILICVLTVVAGGCHRGPARPKLMPVHGTVTLDGKPQSGVVVTFVPIGSTQGAGGSAFTDSNGKYELLYRSGEKGTPVGEYRVSVAKSGFGDVAPATPTAAADTSQLHLGAATVPEGGGTVDFPLKSNR